MVKSSRPLNLDKAPFPWFGGKSQAAPTVWSLLGDVAHYVEPFAGSLAVLLNRPHEPNRTYFSETVNDLDGFVVNAWRAIQSAPDDVAFHASNPVAECDLSARHLAIVKWRESGEMDHLAGDPEFFDARMAGWWLWGVSSWIGSGFGSGSGPWVASEDGRLVKQSKPGVHRKLPHLGDDGRGVNRPQLREPGVPRQRPHLVGDGQGVNRPQLREPGIPRKRPHLGDNGQGVNHAGLRNGMDPAVVMPKLVEWMEHLSARLRHVRIVNGDWKRICSSGAMYTLPIRSGGKKKCGVFLDPPYADTAKRAKDLYAIDSEHVAHDVREWAIENGSDERLRIVLAGFEGEHGDSFEDAGWTSHEWFKPGFLRGGLGKNQPKERLWASPGCLDPNKGADTESDAPKLFNVGDN